jgi:hypothetical protein
MDTDSTRTRMQELASLDYALGTVRRPNPIVLVWRWRYEAGLAVAAGGIAIITDVAHAAWIPVGLGALIVISLVWTGSRRRLIAWAWFVITPHRVRTACAQAWIHSRSGRIPAVLSTSRQPFGERVRLWCPAGVSLASLVAAREVLAAACWARDVHVTGSPRGAQVVTLDVIRRDPSEGWEDMRLPAEESAGEIADWTTTRP